jgi:hypothetical protein
MNKLPELVKFLPENPTVLNCNICFMKGKRNKNVFEIYADKKYKYFKCVECDSIYKIKKGK